MKTDVIITEKGASMKSNKWKAGDKISCHPNLAESFIKKGIAKAVSKSDSPVKENKIDEPVTNNKVQEPRTNDKQSKKLK